MESVLDPSTTKGVAAEKAMNRMRTAFASAIYLGYQLAQAQLADLPVKDAS